MRKFLAIALVVLGVLGLAGGVFARAQLGAASSITVRADTSSAGAYIVLDPGVLTSGDGQPARIGVEGLAGVTYGVFVGLAGDVEGFIGDAKSAHITGVDGWENAAVTPADQAGPATGLNPLRADLWISAQQGVGSFEVQPPVANPALGPTAVLIAADGQAAAPAAVTLSWKLPVDATWTVILMGVGILVAIAGLVLLGLVRRAAAEARREAEHARKLQEAAAKARVFDEALVVSDPEPADVPSGPATAQPAADEASDTPRKREGLR
ncbi:hypothetical protein JT358_06710 [Micrococcales bacterium 31B]|nr:hypothetical protein [Micrococcales bacterium 31B]